MPNIQGPAHFSWQSGSSKSHSGSPKNRAASPKPIPKPNVPISDLIEIGVGRPSEESPEAGNRSIKEFDPGEKYDVTFVSYELYYETKIKTVLDAIIKSRKADCITDISFKIGSQNFHKVSSGNTRFTPALHAALYKRFGDLVPEVLPYIDYKKGYLAGRRNRRKAKIERNTANSTGRGNSPTMVFNRLRNFDGLSYKKLVAEMNKPGISVDGKPYGIEKTAMREKMNRASSFTKWDVEQAIAVGLVEAGNIKIPPLSTGDAYQPRVHLPEATRTTKRKGEEVPLALSPKRPRLPPEPAASLPDRFQTMYSHPQDSGQSVPYGASVEGIFSDIGSGVGEGLDGPLLGDPALPTLDSFFNHDPDQYSLQPQLPTLVPASLDVPSIPVGNTLEVPDANWENSWYSTLDIPVLGFDAGMNPDSAWNHMFLSNQSAIMPLSSGYESYANIPYPFEIDFTERDGGDIGLRGTGMYYGMAEPYQAGEASRPSEKKPREG